MLSLNKRALIAGSLIIAAFFALGGLSLQQAFDRNARSAMTQRLLGQVYVLIAGSQRDDSGNVFMPATWHSEKVSMISPNLLAEIQHGHDLVWQSTAMADLAITRNLPLQRNHYNLQLQQTPQGGFGVLSYAVAWGGPHDQDFTYFRVAEDLSRYQRQRDEFTHTLWVSLGGVALVLLLVQSQMLRWELAPLKRAQSEIERIRAGEGEHLEQDYPGELRSLTGSINQLLAQQREQIARHRHSLADLAHSLKTPLAILHNALSGPQANQAQDELIKQQLQRIDQIASYQLARAATAAQAGFQKAVNVAALTRSVLAGLNKVYAHKAPELIVALEDEVWFAIDEGDFMEIGGNLLDNAFKWCRHRVEVCVRIDNARLLVLVADDGEGFSSAQLEQGPQRGLRGDEQTPGHGLGLAMVADIVEAYRGDFHLANNAADAQLEGACVKLCLPLGGWSGADLTSAPDNTRHA